MRVRSARLLANLPALFLAAAALSSCAGVHVTPRADRETIGTNEETEAALSAWH